MPRIAIAVVCRLKSTRLTYKALRLINGVPSVQRCLNNCLAAGLADRVILATSTVVQDEPLLVFEGESVILVRGDPDNLADRMLTAAEASGADTILRVTADCPAVSPELLERQIAFHLNNKADLTLPPEDAPIGIGGDVYSVEALRKLVRLAAQYKTSLALSEYLSFFFIHNPDEFNVVRLPSEDRFSFPDWRLTLDEIDDLRMFEALYSGLSAGHRPVGFPEVRDYLMAHPEVARINAGVQTKWKDQERLVAEIREAATFRR